MTSALGDLVDMTFGFAFKSAEFTDGPDDVRLARGDNISQGRLRWDGVKCFPLERAGEVPGYELRVGDVVVAMDRPWIEAGLKYAVVRESDVPSLLVQRVARLRARPGLDQGYLAAIIGDRSFTNYVIGVQTGSAVPHISGGQIARYQIPFLPHLEEQRGVAQTLSSIDDRIEIDRSLVTLIPDLIRALVVRGTMDDAVDVAVADLAEYVNGGAYTKGASGDGRMVIRIAELNSGPGGSTVYSDIDVPDNRIARRGDLLMSWSGSLNIYRWARDEAVVNQHIFKVKPTSRYPAWLVFDRLNAIMPVFQGIAKDKATTMGHIQRGHLESTTVTVPSPHGVADIERKAGPLWERLLLADREIVELSALRQVLLPELLNRRVRVREAQEGVTT